MPTNNQVSHGLYTSITPMSLFGLPFQTPERPATGPPITPSLAPITPLATVFRRCCADAWLEASETEGGPSSLSLASAPGHPALRSQECQILSQTVKDR